MKLVIVGNRLDKRLEKRKGSLLHGEDVVRLARRYLLNILFCFLFLCSLNQLAAAAAFSANDSVPRITVQELKAKLDRGEAVVIIDNRTGRDYTDSKIKIKGAIRIPIVQLENRYSELPEDKEIVTYCT